MAFSKPKLKVTFAEDLGFEVVDIYVGPERKRFVVHKNLLVRQSDYFKSALTGSFIEAEENSIHLKEEDPAAVALLIGWLYNGVIPGTENLANPFGAFVSTMFSSKTPIQVPVSEMGTIYPFNPTQTPTNNATPHCLDLFQHICPQFHYAIFSPEELRLADYKLNRKFGSDEPLAAPSTQSPATGGLFGNFGNSDSLFAQLAPQSTVSQSSSLFGLNYPFTPATSPPFTAPAFGFFGQPASQPFVSQADPTQSATLPPLHPPNIFASRWSPFTSAASSNSSGMNRASQSPTTSFGGAIPDDNRFIRSADPSNHDSSHSMNSSTSLGLFGTATLNRPPNLHIAQPRFGGSTSTANAITNVFAEPSSSVSQGPSVSASTSTFGPVATSATSYGTFAGGGPWAPFGAAPNQSETLSELRVQHQSSIDASSLPPGATMITITPHKPRLGEFGSYASIKHAQSPGLVISGIPRADPQNEQYFDVEKQQLTLLNLCIMAEIFCWPSLFDESINAYIRGEHKLQRPIALDFIDRTYARTNDGSTLRLYALDSLCQMRAEGIEDLTPYMELAQKHQDFLADLLGKVLGSSSPSDFSERILENYKYGMGREEEML